MLLSFILLNHRESVFKVFTSFSVILCVEIIFLQLDCQVSGLLEIVVTHFLFCYIFSVSDSQVSGQKVTIHSPMFV